MALTTYDKHIHYFKSVLDQLKTFKNEEDIRIVITDLMFYLDKNHLHDKNYLNHHKLFLACEVGKEKLSNISEDILLSFLTMIYRIDYIDPNSDAFMIYYNNKMLERILEALVKKIINLKRSVK